MLKKLVLGFLMLFALALMTTGAVIADEADDDAVAICELAPTDADYLACIVDVYEDEEDGDGPIGGGGGDTGGGCRWPRCGGGPVDVFGGQGPVDPLAGRRSERF